MNNLTTFPEGKTEKEFDEWKVFDNSEFRHNENFVESWADVDKLKSLGKEVYLITVNASSSEDHTKPDPIRKESDEKKRHTFAFDYAITEINQDDYWQIWYWIMKYRNTKIDDQRQKKPWNVRAFEALYKIELEIQKHKYIEAHFS